MPRNQISFLHESFAFADLTREWVTRILTGQADDGVAHNEIHAYVAASMVTELILAISAEIEQPPIEVWQRISLGLIDETKRPK